MGKRRYIKDELSVEQFIKWREDGLSYTEIGEKIGFANPTVCKYGKEVLPEHLQGLQKKKPKPKPSGSPTCIHRIRAKMEGTPPPLDPKTGECLECREQDEKSWREREAAELAAADHPSEQQIRQELQAVREEAEERALARPPEPALVAEVMPVPVEAPFPSSAELDQAWGLVSGRRNGARVVALILGTDVLGDLLGEDHSVEKEAWMAFLAGVGMERSRLAKLVPPSYVRSEGDRWEYLQQIATGRVWVPRGGLLRRRLKRVLARAGRPVLSRGAVGILEVLVGVGRWVVRKSS